MAANRWTFRKGDARTVEIAKRHKGVIPASAWREGDERASEAARKGGQAAQAMYRRLGTSAHKIKELRDGQS